MATPSESSQPQQSHALQKQAMACYQANVDATRKLLDACDHLAQPLAQATAMLLETIVAGGKMLCCGNGGSAADAAHFAGEITGRYKLDRPGYPALDLTASPALITALINDFPAQEVFARQIQALGKPGDALVVFTTSGQSENIRLALAQARKMHIRSIAFLGRDGGRCAGMADIQLIVPSQTTARIQEIHQLFYHTICETLDEPLAKLGER